MAVVGTRLRVLLCAVCGAAPKMQQCAVCRCASVKCICARMPILKAANVKEKNKTRMNKQNKWCTCRRCIFLFCVSNMHVKFLVSTLFSLARNLWIAKILHFLLTSYILPQLHRFHRNTVFHWLSVLFRSLISITNFPPENFAMQNVTNTQL